MGERGLLDLYNLTLGLASGNITINKTCIEEHAITNATNASLSSLAFGPTSYTANETAGGHYDGAMKDRIKSVQTIFYSLIIIVAFLGNGLLVLTMTFTKKMRTTTNYFLLNMAVGDLFVAVLCAPYQLASWKFPSIKTFDRRICKTMPFLQLTTIGISIFTMVAIAIVRYRAVLSPLRQHISKRSSILIILIVWLASVACASPMIFVYEIQELPGSTNNSIVKRCDEFGWPDPNKDAATYTYVLFVVQYALPGLLTGYLYLRVLLALWFHSFPGMQNMSKASCLQFRKKHYRRKKTIVMLLTIFLTFMACNLPMHVISFIFYVEGSNFKAPPYMHIITTCAEMIMYTNSAINPILYGFMHNKFSSSAKGLLRWVFCREKRQNYENVPLKKKEKRLTLMSGATSTSTNKNEEQHKICEIKF